MTEEYSPVGFVDNDGTGHPLDAARFNHVETGITNAQKTANEALILAQEQPPAFIPSHSYAAGYQIVHEKQLWSAKKAFSSGLTFKAENWNAGVGGGGGESGVTEKKVQEIIESGTYEPIIAVTSRIVELGSVSGSVKPNLAEGRVFTLTSTGTVKLQAPINPPAAGAAIYVELEIIGNHTIETPGIKEWIGEEPTFNLKTSTSVNLVMLVSYNDGSTWYAVGAEAASAVIAEGATLGKTSLQKKENLKDLENAGESRQNLHVPELSVAVLAIGGTVTEPLEKVPGSGFETVTLAAGETVLLTNQAVPKNNGPWVISAGAWTRPTDFPTGAKVKARTIAALGKSVSGENQGSEFAMSVWVLDTTAEVTVGTTNQVWKQIGPKIPKVNTEETSKKITETLEENGYEVYNGMLAADPKNKKTVQYDYETKKWAYAALTVIT